MSGTLTAKWTTQDDSRPVRYSLIHHTAIGNFFFHAPFSRSAQVQQSFDWPLWKRAFGSVVLCGLKIDNAQLAVSLELAGVP